MGTEPDEGGPSLHSSPATASLGFWSNFFPRYLFPRYRFSNSQVDCAVFPCPGSGRAGVGDSLGSVIPWGRRFPGVHPVEPLLPLLGQPMCLPPSFCLWARVGRHGSCPLLLPAVPLEFSCGAAVWVSALSIRYRRRLYRNIPPVQRIPPPPPDVPHCSLGFGYSPTSIRNFTLIVKIIESPSRNARKWRPLERQILDALIVAPAR